MDPSYTPSKASPAPRSDAAPIPFNGNCHCGAVRFTVMLPANFTINRCTCSICEKTGYLLVYPLREELVFTRGGDTMKEYHFGSRKKTHRFCGTCGGSVMIDFNGIGKEDDVALNARMIHDIDLAGRDYTFFDGKNLLKPAYCLEE